MANSRRKKAVMVRNLWDHVLEGYKSKDKKIIIDNSDLALKCLTDRQKKVIKTRYDLKTGDKIMTTRAAADKLGRNYYNLSRDHAAAIDMLSGPVGQKMMKAVVSGNITEINSLSRKDIDLMAGQDRRDVHNKKYQTRYTKFRNFWGYICKGFTLEEKLKIADNYKELFKCLDGRLSELLEKRYDMYTGMKKKTIRTVAKEMGLKEGSTSALHMKAINMLKRKESKMMMRAILDHPEGKPTQLPRKGKDRDSIESTPLEELGLSNITILSLQKHEIYTVGALMKMSQHGLHGLSGIGKGSVEKIVKKLYKLGIKLPKRDPKIFIPPSF